MAKPNKRKDEEQLRKIGERLKELREKMGLTQDEASHLLGVSQSTIAQFEKGRREISVAVLTAAADLYRTSTDYILGMDERRKISISGNPQIKENGVLAALEKRRQTMALHPDAFKKKEK